jgi:DNA-binding transcriptional LysR family regulator
MDLNLLTTFLSVYKNRSITLAAEELDVSQPAVSASLKRLEAVVGKSLYVREGRGIAPTGAAVALANKIQSPMSVLETVEQKQEQINLYCSEVVLHKVSHIEQMHTVVTPLNEQEVIDDLNTQKVDLVIDAMVTRKQSVIVEEIYQEDGVCVTRKDHPRIGDTMTREQYFAERHIALKIRRNNMGTLEHIANEPIEPRKVSIETESLASMIGLAAITDYIGSTTRSFAETFAPRLGLNIHEIPFGVKPIPLSMLYHRRYASDPFHKAKRKEIVEAITGGTYK